MFDKICTSHPPEEWHLAGGEELGGGVKVNIVAACPCCNQTLCGGHWFLYNGRQETFKSFDDIKRFIYWEQAKQRVNK